MALTHVSLWEDHSWKRISVQEAIQRFRGGVSADSGLFMCELCGQYVALTGGEVRARHFRHSAKEQDKECEDRSTIYGSSYYSFSEKHDLPIKLTIKNSTELYFEMGFYAVPKSVEDKIFKIKISLENSGDSFLYSSERFSKNGMTYLYVGNIPSPKYNLIFTPEYEDVSKLYPIQTDGVSGHGTVFDAASGKKLAYDADVIVDHDYYLVIKGELTRVPRSVNAQEICVINDKWVTWRVFKVTAKEYADQTARFFLQFHCRLTDKPVTMYPVWPRYISSPYFIYHQAEEMLVYFSGNVVPQVAPKGLCRVASEINPKWLVISATDKQLLLSVGRMGVLQYLYFQERTFDLVANSPMVTLKALNGEILENGIYNELPFNKSITVYAEAKGCVEVEYEGNIVNCICIGNRNITVLDGIKYGYSIRVYQGCEVVAWLEFIKEMVLPCDGDEQLLQKLKSCSGKMIHIDHSIGAMTRYFSNPGIKKWLFQQIRNGIINEKALKIIKNEVVKRRK